MNNQNIIIRNISSAANDFIFLVLIESPHKKIKDVWGNREIVGDSRKRGIEISYVQVTKGQPTRILSTNFLENCEVNPFSFSNVGFYKLDSEVGNVHHIYIFKNGKRIDIKLSPSNPIVIESISYKEKELFIEKPLLIDGLARIVSEL